jgi:hypothetical protein
MFAKVLREQEKARNRLQWAQMELDRAKVAQSDAQPSEHAIRVAAFLAHCADTTTAPSHQNALRAGYPCTGAALAAGLSDALAMRWVGQLPFEKGGGLYWRDQGSTPNCPLVVWGDRFKK